MSSIMAYNWSCAMLVLCDQSSLGLNFAALQADLLYLHNAAESHLADDNKQQFMQKIRDAFRQLEEFRCVAACHCRCK